MSMEYLRGWLRVTDRAECGGTLAEGSSCEFSDGFAYTFQRARMSRNRSFTIAGGYPQSILSNGAAQALDGQLPRGGCRLISPLGGVDGVAGN